MEECNHQPILINGISICQICGLELESGCVNMVCYNTCHKPRKILKNINSDYYRLIEYHKMPKIKRDIKPFLAYLYHLSTYCS